MTHSLVTILKNEWRGILLAILIGLVAYSIQELTRSAFADPLLVAMMIGIILRRNIKDDPRFDAGFRTAPKIFIPIGVIFYAAQNLNFMEYAEVDYRIIALLIVVIVVYFGSILFLGKSLKQKTKITYLIATGSAICGASAIAITSPVVDAEPDDISISLFSVAVAGLVGLFIIIPFLGTLLGLTNKVFALLAGSVLQFTGFVKAAVSHMLFAVEEIPAKEAVALALSVKTVRYLGLLIALPLFASLLKKRVFFPWFLWAFLGAGLIGSWIYSSDKIYYTQVLLPVIKPVYNIAWSIALAAIGLNADIKNLLSNNGMKALVMAFAGFMAAIITFFIGMQLIL